MYGGDQETGATVSLNGKSSFFYPGNDPRQNTWILKTHTINTISQGLASPEPGLKDYWSSVRSLWQWTEQQAPAPKEALWMFFGGGGGGARHIDSYSYWQLISLLLILSLTACGNSPFSPVFVYSTLRLRLLAGVCYSPPLCLCARLCPHRLSLQECDLLQLLWAQDSLKKLSVGKDKSF